SPAYRSRPWRPSAEGPYSRYRGSKLSSRRRPGPHASTVSGVDEWVPTFTGTTSFYRDVEQNCWQGNDSRVALVFSWNDGNASSPTREAVMAGTRIGVIGCAGRMGRMLVADIAATEGCVLAGGVARPGAACVGQDLGELAGVPRLGIAVGDNAERLLRDSDVAVDFTMPTATADHAKLAASLGKPIVIGTTGL